ncbi:hypothetical protein FLJC2902T_13220 [Flavobacterium limnosediminis JC2902]|uniref:Uncharacterized protein n=1 Tax=Flavobacterium limnosediminis JC2902 TaxID=1341181 RepID=V6SPX3_9FLAO|nr:hypothetical protein [Flavobacterium limnosediminis]ESU28728.1 hypothetical protein FLJC2902T_13220 [Flavobacterium limnosediminis JC2902]
MNGLQEMIFISEIALQSKIAQRAAECLKANENSFDKIEVWSSIQSILVAAANVSKILWSSNKKYEKRGERLRQILRVEKENILSDRKFRNHFEHYDDRIEEWFCNNSNGVYIDLAMNPSFPGRTLNNNHRGYNSFDNTLVFRDQSLDLNEVLKALEDILNNCKPHTLT